MVQRRTQDLALEDLRSARTSRTAGANMEELRGLESMISKYSIASRAEENDQC